MDKGRIEWGGDESREDRYKYVLITPRITKFAVLVYLDLCRALDRLLKVIYSVPVQGRVRRRVFDVN